MLRCLLCSTRGYVTVTAIQPTLLHGSQITIMSFYRHQGLRQDVFISWVVGRRTREIGIRMALGEAASRVRVHILADALRLGGLGILLGAVLAYGSAHYLRAFVAGSVRARDPLMLAATMLILLLVTAAAAWLPARRASRVDPLLAIRAE